MALEPSDSIYAMSISVGGDDDGDLDEAGPRLTVLYCDTCRRWAARREAHTCWRNWWVRLSDALRDREPGAHRRRLLPLAGSDELPPAVRAYPRNP
jgi:hypothetical protein